MYDLYSDTRQALTHDNHKLLLCRDNGSLRYDYHIIYIIACRVQQT